MKFTPSQWALCFLLDFFIKSLLVGVFGLLVTLGVVPIIDFVVAAFLVTLFHFLCLFLGAICSRLLSISYHELSGRTKAAVTLISANALFVPGMASVSVWGSRPEETYSLFENGLSVGSLVAVTNLISILIAGAIGRLFRQR